MGNMIQNMFLKTCSPLKTLVRTHLGYIPFEGRLGRRPTNWSKFYAELRNVMFMWNSKKVRATNIKMIVKTEIVDDRRDPIITFDLNDGRQLEIRTGNLTELEIATVVNSYLLPLVKEEELSEVVSKGAKAGGKTSKKGRK